MKITIDIHTVQDWTPEQHKRLVSVLQRLCQEEKYRDVAKLAQLRYECEAYFETQAQAQYFRERACFRLEKLLAIYHD